MKTLVGACHCDDANVIPKAVADNSLHCRNAGSNVEKQNVAYDNHALISIAVSEEKFTAETGIHDVRWAYQVSAERRLFGAEMMGSLHWVASSAVSGRGTFPGDLQTTAWVANPHLRSVVALFTPEQYKQHMGASQRGAEGSMQSAQAQCIAPTVLRTHL